MLKKLFMSPVNNGVRKYQTVGNLIKTWKITFANNNVSDPTSSLVIIMCHALGIKNLSDLELHKERVLNNEESKEFEKMCDDRAKGKPVQYVIGEWDFCNLTLKMKPPVFIPRPETEELSELAKSIVRASDKAVVSVLDVGCGSGSISLELLHSCSKVYCTTVDRNPDAVDLTKLNARLNSLDDHSRLQVVLDELKNGCIPSLKNRKFDIIISNPPYIPSSQIGHLQKEVVNFEDRGALDGGSKGLDTITDLILLTHHSLNGDGCLVFEMGDGQAVDVLRLIEQMEESFDKKFSCQIHKDFRDQERFAEIRIIDSQVV